MGGSLSAGRFGVGNHADGMWRAMAQLLDEARRRLYSILAQD